MVRPWKFWVAKAKNRVERLKTSDEWRAAIPLRGSLSVVSYYGLRTTDNVPVKNEPSGH